MLFMKKVFFVLLFAIPMFVIGCDEDKGNVPELNIKPLTGVFSVAENKRVVFSSGNLQYNLKNQKWKFADSQLEYLGVRNYHIVDSTYDGYIDLFGWSTDKTQYGTNTPLEMTASNNFIDWGQNIGDGWYTMSETEWMYLRNCRHNADQLYGIACINDVNGCILLPDDWCPIDGVNFCPGVAKSSNNDRKQYAEHNYYTLAQWMQMEAAGAVFLPAAGYCEPNRVCYDIQRSGDYWTSNEMKREHNTTPYRFVEFLSNNFHINQDLARGISVRLVKELK